MRSRSTSNLLTIDPHPQRWGVRYMISNYIEDHQQELTSSCDDLSLLAIHHWPNIIQHWHVLNLDMDLNMFIDIILALPSAQQAYVHRITPDELRETCNKPSLWISLQLLSIHGLQHQACLC